MKINKRVYFGKDGDNCLVDFAQMIGWEWTPCRLLDEKTYRRIMAVVKMAKLLAKRVTITNRAMLRAALERLEEEK